nr:3623_t:CDS:10 [Entrophospora candida]
MATNFYNNKDRKLSITNPNQSYYSSSHLFPTTTTANPIYQQQPISPPSLINRSKTNSPPSYNSYLSSGYTSDIYSGSNNNINNGSSTDLRGKSKIDILLQNLGAEVIQAPSIKDEPMSDVKIKKEFEDDHNSSFASHNYLTHQHQEETDSSSLPPIYIDFIKKIKKDDLQIITNNSSPVSVLNELHQKLKFPKTPKYDYTLDPVTGKFFCKLEIFGNVFRTTSPTVRKQQAKEDVAKAALSPQSQNFDSITKSEGWYRKQLMEFPDKNSRAMLLEFCQLHQLPEPQYEFRVDNNGLCYFDCYIGKRPFKIEEGSLKEDKAKDLTAIKVFIRIYQEFCEHEKMQMQKYSPTTPTTSTFTSMPSSASFISDESSLNQGNMDTLPSNNLFDNNHNIGESFMENNISSLVSSPLGNSDNLLNNNELVPYVVKSHNDSSSMNNRSFLTFGSDVYYPQMFSDPSSQQLSNYSPIINATTTKKYISLLYEKSQAKHWNPPIFYFQNVAGGFIGIVEVKDMKFQGNRPYSKKADAKENIAEIAYRQLSSDGSLSKDGKYIRLPPPVKPYILRFNVRAGTLVSNNGTLYTNYPVDDFPTEFSRSLNTDIIIRKSGAFEFYVEYKELSRTPENSSIPLALDGLVIESVLPKLMGRFSEWDPHIKAISELGYNMIHFVPMQIRGRSNSPYSIYDQLSFSEDLFDPEDFDKSPIEKINIVHNVLRKIEDIYGILSLTDIVWNHTACNSKWLEEHPEAGYNLINSPHLVPAFELDVGLMEFTNNLTELGYSDMINNEQDLDALIEGVKLHVINKIKLWEYYVIDVKEALIEFETALKDDIEYDKTLFNDGDISALSLKEQAKLLAIDDGEPEKNAIKENVADKAETNSTETMLKKFQEIVNEINLPFYKSYDEDVAIILDNLWNRAKYLRLDPNGPKQGKITQRLPLAEPYFTHIPLNETTKNYPKGALAVANNGWIWNANPLQDFASSDSFSYLRREVIVWGDCVKLRYGKSRDDSPWLWDHMKEYTTQLASLFHGFRIDNCHSTPIHVGQYLLDAARSIRPNLYVVAELFTGSEEMDIEFVSKLGINSLIREAMQAWDPRELSRLVHRHGGKPVGSMDMGCLNYRSTCVAPDGTKDAPCVVVPIVGSKTHALFMDCTHDNEMPNQKRTAEDSLSTGALVAMSSCAIGSVKGFDEIYPGGVDLVNETRHYNIYDNPLEIGIGRVKKVLQHLHIEMTFDGYIETHVHHENDASYLLIARCAFSGLVVLRGDSKALFSTYLEVTSRKLTPDKMYLTGLDASLKSLNTPNTRELTDHDGNYTEITLPKEFPSGSVALLETSISDQHDELDEFIISNVEEVLKDLSLVDLNIVLYRCNSEENDVTPGNGVYNIPGYGDLTYCGLEGFMSVLREIIKKNDLGHPFCSNLREGHWALEYVISRLERLDAIKKVPNFLVPKYFALLVKTAYTAAVKESLKQLSPFVFEGGPFIRSLALVSVQMYGTVLSTGLHPTEIGPSVAAGLPHFTFQHMRCWGRDVFISLRGLFITTGNFEAARRHIIGFGSVLKHGLIPNLLDSGRRPRYNCRDASWWYLQAVQDYCNFAPEGLKFLSTPVARRFPKTDEFVEYFNPLAYSYSSTILEIIHEILERHARGIHFREWNAGPNLDHAMTSKGFDIDIEVDWSTGFLFGGNQWNCGTWMDKMGDSEKAGNKGIPATPRDGAAVEIIGLLKSTLRWIIGLIEKGVYPWKGVEVKVNGATKLITFLEWNDLIQNSFEKYFYVPLDLNDDSKYALNTKLVNRRGIYKDIYRSTKEYEDYQLRPNFPIAMVVAPELFEEEHAMQALIITREILAGPLGMRTLDPKDWAYRGNYDNNNDGDDKSIAKGWNYHQGPEWLWCTGYFLRAYLYFDTRVGIGKNNLHESIHNIINHLLPHREMIEKSPWAGLPELTNANGVPCYDSCPSQAWSSATLLDLFNDIKNFEKK